jgi:hypothetical protein
MSIPRWLGRPWLHFLVLGFVLFRIEATLFPPPKPVIGPLPVARIDALQEQWFASTGRLPSAAQSERMIRSELDRDMLFQRALELDVHLNDTVVYQRLLRNMSFLQMSEGKMDNELYREALDMRLHLSDEVIKRRLIQIMEQFLLAANPPLPPTERHIEAEFAKRSDELRRPARYSIQHLYFNRAREGEIDRVIATIKQKDLSAEQAREMSSPFLPGYSFNNQSPDQLARHFGGSFVTNLTEASPVSGEWLGPVRSTYGLHYVWIESIEPERDARLEEVHGQIQRDLAMQRKRDALQGAIKMLREEYVVII